MKCRCAGMMYRCARRVYRRSTNKVTEGMQHKSGEVAQCKMTTGLYKKETQKHQPPPKSDWSNQLYKGKEVVHMLW